MATSGTRNVLVLGAGKIGGAIVDLLHATGDYRITLADSDQAFLAQAAGDRAMPKRIDVSDKRALLGAMQGQQAVLSALPFFLNPGVAEACAEGGVHYFDLTEDVATTRAVRKVAEGAKVAFVP